MTDEQSGQTSRQNSVPYMVTAADLQEQYDEIESDCMGYFMGRPQDTERREIAEYFQPHSHRAVLFKMLDERSYSEIIWRTIKPRAEKPFREDIDV